MTSLRDRLSQFRDWATSENALASLPPQRLQEISVRLRQLEDRIDTPPSIPIALLGSTGAGKSTLINTLLGANILNSNNLQFCTAAVTAVGYERRQDFRARLQFVTYEDWQREVQVVQDYLQATNSASPEDTDATSTEIRRHYERKLRAVYQLDPAAPIPHSLPPLPSRIEYLLDRDFPLQLQSNDLIDLRRQLKDYVTSDGTLWPLVQLAEISGPFEVLSGGIQLVDLPGLNDPNPAREEITRNYLKSSPYVWLVFNSKRGLTRDLRDFLLETGLVRQMMLDGNLPGFAMVATHADDIDIDEQSLEMLGLPEDAPESQIVAERNRRVVSNCRNALRELAADLGAQAQAIEQEISALAEQLAAVSIFTVGSKSYQKANGLAPRSKMPDLPVEATQVPALTGHLLGIARQQGLEAHLRSIERDLDLLIQEAEVFFRSELDELASVAQATRNRRQQLGDACAKPHERHRERLTALGLRVDSNFKIHRETFEDRLNSAARDARSNLNQVIEQWRLIHHNTLLAAVLHQGRFRSSNGLLYDLNKTLAEPLLQAIPFAWNDFFSQRLEGILSLLSEQLRFEADTFLRDVEIAALRSRLDDDGLLDGLPGALDAAKRSVEIQTDEARKALSQTVRQVRSDLASGIEEAAQESMKPGYARAASERGTGMKARILAILRERAQSQILALFETIRTDLMEGVGALGGQLSQRTDELCIYVEAQSSRVVKNLTQTDLVGGTIAERRAQAETALAAITPLRANVAGAEVPA